jgi:hypothetical protein
MDDTSFLLFFYIMKSDDFYVSKLILYLVDGSDDDFNTKIALISVRP